MTHRIRQTAARSALALALGAGAMLAPSAHACGSEPMLGTMCLFAGNFAPRGFAFTDGQLLSIAQNSALFSILGTTYGGDGSTTFALPDTRGRVIVGPRQGAGLSTYALGQRGGQERVALTLNEMPSHSHAATTTVSVTANGQSANGNQDGPAGNVWANKPRGAQYSTQAPNVTMAAGALTATATTAVAAAGGSQAHENRPPYIAINYIIALQGIFPSRQ